MKFIDLFAGIGGFRYGIEKAIPDAKCVYSNEWDKYASSVYKKHYQECDTRDIATVDTGELPSFDLLAAGFPCQSFSLAGSRRGFSDTRGTLFFEIARIAQAKQPSLLLLENVKGILYHDKGETFRIILNTLGQLGYDCQWQVCNSKNFNVPQHRERVYIVGHLRETPRPKVFPITASNQQNTEVWFTTDRQERRIRDDKSTFRRPTKRREIHSYREGEIRRLTPLECERLQGFPDDWTKFGELYLDTKLMKMRNTVMSDTQRYKMCGNAVTTTVVEAIAKRLI